ncbi:MAG: glycine cleavage system protein GcvH [Bryobacterales bacterium]|nr:glycine cleavage system protein GcvH [Bryobacterales bacterium]
MDYPIDYRYSREHEWVRLENGTATVGITHHAQDQLGDVVFVELPSVGSKLEAEGAFGAVESVKAVSDIYAPISGDVIAVNEALMDAPELINSDPHGEGWLVKLTVFDRSEIQRLLNADQYTKYVAAESDE